MMTMLMFIKIPPPSSNDFEHLLAGVRAARASGRRLVLPGSMNCRSSPAWEAYGLNETLREEEGGPEAA